MKILVLFFFLQSVLCLNVLAFNSALNEAAHEPGPTFQSFIRDLGGKLFYDPRIFSPDYLSGNPQKASVFVPYGRSLERLASDSELPRALISYMIKAKPDESSLANGYVLVGYTAKNNQLQIIAANNTGRGNGGYNDFILVEDFLPGKVPRIVYPNGGLCLACHQNGNLIFPTAKWEEIPFEKSPFVEHFKKSKNEIISGLANQKTEVFFFDLIIRELSKKFSVKQQLGAACPSDPNCRIELLKMATGFQNDIKVIKSFFNSTTKLNNLNSIFIASNQISARLKTEENNQEAYTFPFREGEDPLFPRRMDFGFFANKDESDDKIEQNIRDFTIVEDAAISGLELSKEFFKSTYVLDLVENKWPVRRSDLNKSIEDFHNGREVQKPSKVEEPALVMNNPVSVFYKYCFSCHVPNGLVTSLKYEELKEFRGLANSGRTASNLVSRGLMPPSGSLQMTKIEKEILLQYLAD